MKKFFLLSLVLLSGIISGQTPLDRDTICFIRRNGAEMDSVEFNIETEFSPPASPTHSLLDSVISPGCISFQPSPEWGTYWISGTYDAFPLDGVTIADLIMMTKHIIGIAPLDPYQLIAGDVNKSGTVTSFDIVELRKLMLGIYSHLPYDKSWRIVNSHYTFPTPTNPFPQNNGLIPDNISSADSLPFTFIGIKIGDLDDDAARGPLDTLHVIQNLDTVALYLPDIQFAEGAEFEVLLRMPSVEHAALQFDLQWNNSYLKQTGFHNLLPGDVFNISALGQNNLLALYFTFGTLVPGPDQFFAKINFKALKSGSLRDLISLRPDFRAMALQGNLKKAHPLRLVFANTSSLSIPFPEEPQVRVVPNPGSEAQRFEFYGHPAGACYLNIYTAEGKLIEQQRVQLQGRGVEDVMLPASTFPYTGVYHYHIQGAHWQAAGTLLRQ